jgi:hypothetical protein
MRRDELLKRLVMLPPDTDVVVDIGRIEIDIVDIVGLTYPGERSTIALSLHPNDLRDAFAANRTSD